MTDIETAAAELLLKDVPQIDVAAAVKALTDAAVPLVPAPVVGTPGTRGKINAAGVFEPDEVEEEPDEWSLKPNRRALRDARFLKGQIRPLRSRTRRKANRLRQQKESK